MSERVQQYSQLLGQVRKLRDQGAPEVREAPYFVQLDRVWSDMNPDERRQASDEPARVG